MPSNATIDRNGKRSMIMIPAKNYEDPSLAYIDLGIILFILLIDMYSNFHYRRAICIEFLNKGECSYYVHSFKYSGQTTLFELRITPELKGL